MSCKVVDQNDFDDLEDRVDDIEDQIGDFDVELQDLKDRVTKLETILAGLVNPNASLNSDES